jgi:hypothetical protein
MEALVISFGMPSALLFLVLAVLMLLIAVHWVLAMLRKYDPATYTELGRPDLFKNNTLMSNWLFWRWIYTSSITYRGYGRIQQVLWLIRIGTVLYVVALIGWSFSIVLRAT